MGRARRPAEPTRPHGRARRPAEPTRLARRARPTPRSPPRWRLSMREGRAAARPQIQSRRSATLPCGSFGLHEKAGMWYATSKYNFTQRNVDMNRNLFVSMAAMGIAGGLALSAMAADAYIDTDGTQSIVLDYYVKPNTKIVADYAFLSVTPLQSRVFAASGREAGMSCAHYINGSGTTSTAAANTPSPSGTATATGAARPSPRRPTGARSRSTARARRRVSTRTASSRRR